MTALIPPAIPLTIPLTNPMIPFTHPLIVLTIPFHTFVIAAPICCVKLTTVFLIAVHELTKKSWILCIILVRSDLIPFHALEAVVLIPSQSFLRASPRAETIF